MCTRFFLDTEHSPEIQPYIEAAAASPRKAAMTRTLGKEMKTSGEIRPTDMVAAIAPSPSGKKSVYPMVWGYHIGGLNRLVVNARVESARDKKSFSNDWKKHRCVIPASYYFEWEHRKTAEGKTILGSKYALWPENATATWLGGLYRLEARDGFLYPVFTILTRAPGPAAAKIHDRIPLILPENMVDAWIRPDSNPEEILREALTDMAVRPLVRPLNPPADS